VTTGRLGQAAALFARALELPVEQRTGYVEAACRDDPALLARVQAMLAADAGPSPILDATPDGLAAALGPADPATLEGRRIGPYRVIEIVGRGGMGVVCRAEREDVGKQVALKLVAGGLAAPDRVARFLQERRVLAQLDHPHIARLLDAGVADDGMPWLAMEYVAGLAIDRYGDANCLTIDQRLVLFEKVAGAVAYAHRHLVVHRDLKPSNILVGEDGEPRLLDFGIAKLLDESGSGIRLTETGIGPMTPQYASPEQLRGEPITTASDVYQLGALLFELLTGRPPHPERLMTRVGRADTEVSKPSDAVERGAPRTRDPADPPAATSGEIALARGTTPARLRRRLAGDLDNIVVKATDPDPGRRYATAAELAVDVRRHRDGLPVVARPATTAYRIRKFVTRHRAGTAMAVVLVLALLGFALSMAEQSRRTAAQSERAEQVSSLLASLFAGADPVAAQGEAITVASILDRGAERLRTHPALDPEVRARLLGVMAQAYRNLGQDARAVELLSESYLIQRRVLRADHPDRLSTAAELMGWKAEAGDGDEALRMAKEYRGVAARLPASRARDRAMILSAAGFAFMGTDRDSARAAMEQGLAVFRSVPGAKGDPLERVLVNLGYLADLRGDRLAAKQYWSEALALRRERLGPNHSVTAKTSLDLALALVQTDEVAAAESLVTESVETHRRVFAGDHPRLAAALNAQARILGLRERHREAIAVQREAVAMTRRLDGGKGLTVAGYVANLAGHIQKGGSLVEAAALHREALATYRAELGDRNLSTGIIVSNLAFNAYLRRSLAESDSLYRWAVPVLDSAWRGSTRIAATLFDFSVVLMETGKCGEAEPLLRRALQMFRQDRPDHPSGFGTQRNLGVCLARVNQLAAAESLLVDLHQTLHRTAGPDNLYTRWVAKDLVQLYQLLGKPEEADRYRSPKQEKPS
jgi:serine/threonine-protein kinase